MHRRLLLCSFLVTAFASGVFLAQVGQPALPPGPAHEEIVDGLNDETLSLDEVRRLGLAVFSTPFNTFDGLGDGPFDPGETNTRALGMRPTLQGNGLFLRVNGLDAQSCNECHTIVSNRTIPPTLGFGGVGGAVQNAIIMPTLIDVADSADDRVSFVPGHDPSLPLVFDGEADFNGRFSNPPFLFGGGGVELLSKEMTFDLQALLDVAQSSPAGTVVSLDTHGVNFGFIISLGGGDVDLSGIEGIGFTPELNQDSSPEEVLVVRPFGRKGEAFSMRDFDRGAMQFHFGMQPVEVVGEGSDADGDGVEDEVTIGEMTALHIFDVTNPRPFMADLSNQAQQGFNKFMTIGCPACHMPVIETESRFLPLAHPEVPDDPFANVYTEIDLVEVGFLAAPGGGVFVPLFADLKRHNMGPGLRESLEGAGIPNTDFTTARLWGISDTAPYIHDGRASTLFQAIEAHGGEAQTARDTFLGLSIPNQERVIAFLKSLRVPEAPNQDLLP
ncbi:MAG: di-heme oxidoredictase family protein [Acidobacteriota bacterium]